MARATYTVIGADRLEAQLRRLGGAFAGERMLAAAQAGALPIQNAWKRGAPVKTGSYRRSIHVETASVGPTGASVVIGTDITDPPYPYFLEVGTSRMAPRPSMTPAFDEHQEEAAREATEVLRELIRGALR